MKQTDRPLCGKVPKTSGLERGTARTRRAIASYRLTAGITLLGASALLGCSAEVGSVEEAELDHVELGDDAISSVEQAATVCTPESTTTFGFDSTQFPDIYPGASSQVLDDSRRPINDQGEVMVGLRVTDHDSASSSRALRWNATTGAIAHMGLPANVKLFGTYLGSASALNAAGTMVGTGNSCRGPQRATIWRGDDLATNDFDDNTNVFSLVPPEREAPASDWDAFCTQSAARSDVDSSPDVPGVDRGYFEAYDISDNAQPSEVIVGRLNGAMGPLFLETGGPNNGLVVIEAEAAQRNVPGTVPGTSPARARTWSLEGAGATAGMRALPDQKEIQNGVSSTVAINPYSLYAVNSPRLDFDVKFQNTGVYNVWIKGKSPIGTAAAPTADGDSLHVGIDGKEVVSADRITGFTATLGWSKSTMDGVSATVTINTPGVHTVNIWMREDGMFVDKIMLAQAATTPSSQLGTEPTIADASTREHPFKWLPANTSDPVVLLPCTPGVNFGPSAGGCGDRVDLTRLQVNTAGLVVARGGSYFWDASATDKLKNNHLTDLGVGVEIQGINNPPTGTAALVVVNQGTQSLVWRNGSGFTNLQAASCGIFCSAPFVKATVVSDRGEVAGVAGVGASLRAFTWTLAGGMVDRGVVPSGTLDVPTIVDINEKGELIFNGEAGAYYNAPGSSSWTAIPGMARADDINNLSQVVGFAGTVTSGGAVTNLTSLMVWQPQVCVETPNDVYLEAECATTKQGAYATTQTGTTRGTASGGAYIESTAATPATPGAAVDQASYSVNVATAGNYVLYFRAHTNANANDDSWFYQIDNGAWVTMNNNQQAGWAWYAGNSGAAVNLAAGAHTIRIANRENGLATDKLALIQQGAAAPTGLGGTATNCGAPPPAPVCGDNVCNGTETCSGCPIDCQCPTTFPIFSATFDNYAAGNNDGFTFRNDVFGTTATNATARGTDTGRLNVRLGLVPATTANSGAFERTIQLASRSTVTVSFSYGLNMADFFEAAECGEVRVRLGSTYYGTGGNSWVVRRCDGGVNNGTHTFTTAPLAAGTYTLQLGGYVNDNSAADEIAMTTFDNVVVTGQLAP